MVRQAVEMSSRNHDKLLNFLAVAQFPGKHFKCLKTERIEDD